MPEILFQDVSSMIPLYAAAVSAALLLVHFIALSKPFHLLSSRNTAHAHGSSGHRSHSDMCREAFLSKLISQHGGPVTFAFRLARFIGCLVLLGLSLVTAGSQKHSEKLMTFTPLCSAPFKISVLPCVEWSPFTVVVTMAYTSILGGISIVGRPRWSKVVSNHLAILLCVTFAVYAHRDLYPLGTYTKQPQDKSEGWLLWAKIAILGLIGIVFPILSPRQYVPFNSAEPADVPHPEQTASWLSMLTYAWEDPVVYLAYKLPHLSHEKLPPLSDQDFSKNLKKKSFPELDPFSGSKRRHIFFGLLKVYRTEYMILALMISFYAIASVASPIGINYLLLYLETNGEGAVIRPWVWIAWLFLGPTAGSIAIQWYTFLATRVLVRTEGTITQLVFEHALRIRMKAELPDDNINNTDTPTVSSPDTPSITQRRTASPEGPDGSDDETVHASSMDDRSPLRMATLKTQDSKTGKEDSDSQPKSSADNLVGKMNNLVTTDLTNIIEGRDFLFLVLYIPLQTALCIWFLYGILGGSALVGLVVMVLLFPIPGYVGKKIQTVQIKKMHKTDSRVQTVTETMNVLRMIKLFGWENKMDKKITERRDEELVWTWKQKILELINNNLNLAIPLLTMLATYSTYTLIMGQTLSASKVFSSMSIFDIMKVQLQAVFYLVADLIQAKVSLDRVNSFLVDTELLDEYNKIDDRGMPLFIQQEVESSVIGFRDAVFAWSNQSNGSLTPSKRQFTLRVDGSVFFQPGCINLIVGPTGSGKTSLLMALLGEMHFIPSRPTSWFNLARKDGVAYAAQESWVQNETIKENILFGAPYDPIRYKKVLYQCALERDLTLFEAGDQTEVGERGLTLSGGQKARITLARAVYSSAQVLLLDDILAALDVHTSKWIVDKCLAGDLIQGRTVILVTHNVAMTSTISHFVVSLGSNGRIISQGSISDAIAKDGKLAEEIAREQEAIEEAIDQESIVDATDEVDVQPAVVPDAPGKLVVAEEILEGHISWPAFKLYLASLGGQYPLLFWVVFIGFMVITDLFDSVQTWFLGYWASQYEDHTPAEVKVEYYLTVYALLLVLASIGYLSGWAIYYYGSLRASKTIHKKLIVSILGTTLRWLDTTPTSRVITRCTQDIRAIDGPFAQGIGMAVEGSLKMIVKLGAVVFMTPVFLIPGIVVGLLGGLIGRVYMKAQLSVKREMSIAKAPVLGHFGAAIAGLTSIRAYGAEQSFKQKSLTRIDRYTRSARMFYNLNRWVCVRIDSIGALFSAGLAAYLVYGPSSSQPSNVGFSLNMAVGFSSMILWWVRILNEVEVNGKLLERIDSYIQIEQEPKPTEGGKPPAYWPASGDLRVEKLSARYSQDGPKVLQDLSFHIASGERVGVVGRTGSGKSSLTLSLLRSIFTDGEVYYDGIPTRSLNLEDLRSNVTIIPQIPELLTGTLRQNLDPFDQHDDAVLNDALRSAGLFAVQDESDDGRLTLDSPISSGGGNLSVGQRQILALARAMVRGSKLLILDEATSAIDYKTDSAIQSSLRNSLHDVTQIIVAHRLHSIIDADKIMVLDAGKLVEFGSPWELLQNEKGVLRALVDESGDKKALYALA
ncbi:hypothetical protein BJ138DRAFT_1225912, partial [Hygrophoropsis aurantiaca]